jgi:hypothetical protein
LRMVSAAMTPAGPLPMMRCFMRSPRTAGKDAHLRGFVRMDSRGFLHYLLLMDQVLQKSLYRQLTCC